MKRSARAVAAASVAWVGVAAWAMLADSRIGEVTMLLLGMLLLAAVWGLLRATDRERRRWQHTLDAMQAGIVLYDADDRLVLTNVEFRKLYQLDDALTTRGMPFEELLRTRVLRGLVPEAAGHEEAWIAERLVQHRSEGGRSFLREMADSRWRRITEQRLPDGSRLGFSIDVTELVENQRALDAARHEAERAHQLLHDAIEAMPAAVEIYDRSDRLVLFNQRMLQLYPHMIGKTLLGETFDALVRNAVARGKVPEALGREEQWLAERLKARGQSSAPRLQQAPSGAWLQIYETPMPRGGMVTVRLDASETMLQHEALQQANAQLEELSATDALTGLANRRRFDLRLAEEVQRSHRHGTGLALLMIDIDHFKHYNDLHGHPQGDVALQAVAAVLAQQTRRPGELVARYGGEEFALLLPHADRAAAATVAERCQGAMAMLALPHGASPTAAQVTLSIGVALLKTRQREDPAAFVRRADAALYAAKAAGRARTVVDES